MKEVTCGEHTNMRRPGTKFNPHGGLTPVICAPLFLMLLCSILAVASTNRLDLHGVHK
jgi:hypothetical protein